MSSELGSKLVPHNSCTDMKFRYIAVGWSGHCRKVTGAAAVVIPTYSEAASPGLFPTTNRSFPFH